MLASVSSVGNVFFPDDYHIIRDSYGLGGMTRYDRADWISLTVHVS